MSKHAENSINTKVFDLRKKLARLVPKFATTGDRQDQNHWYLDEAGRRVWAYGPTDERDPGIWFPKPIRAGDLARILPGGGYSRLNPNKIISSSCSIFTRTAKMNCYSWNLPAGPVGLDGTCPGARMGFIRESVGKTRIVRDPAAAIEASVQFASADLFDTVPKRSDEAVRRFLCNGCYAIKANYAYESVIINQLVKMAWLVDYALPTGTFVDIMVQCIKEVQAKNAERPVPKSIAARAEWAHPDFFRIHDSGDFFREDHFEAWLEICRRLPKIHFWAPTRIWCDAEMGKVLFRAIRNHDIPPNLAIRPSGLFFDGPQPQIKGLAGGSSATTFTYHDRDDGVEVTINHAGKAAWGCPAYMPSEMGGGSIPTLLDKATVRDVVRNPVPKPQTMRALVDDPTQHGVFYEAVANNQGRYVTDPSTGRPMVLTAARGWVFDSNMDVVGRRPKGQRVQDIPRANVKLVQKFQASGCCSIAMDPYGAEECRICWGVTAQKRDPEIRRLPVVYAEH
jgi:hypothetical protein